MNWKRLSAERQSMDVGTLALSTTGSVAQTCEDLRPTTNSPNLQVWLPPDNIMGASVKSGSTSCSNHRNHWHADASEDKTA